jgi:hypothetical protein
MQVRIRKTGAVMYEAEFRTYQQANGGPTWGQTTEEVLEALGADVVFEGPQATGGTVYQFSQAAGVEQIEGKWYTKYVLGPIFVDTTVDDVTTTAAENETAYIAIKDVEFKTANAARAKADLADTDWADLGSVRNTSVNPHLTNIAEFDAYRLALRAIVVNPPVISTTWPVRPTAQWSNFNQQTIQ